ncbi:cupin domain-containing protein [Pseudomonas sp. SO81]|uniref:cupin domain-containing protein n=1 Tax=Pseudomonas sp. SO81 TaxID=2983246 RepID=UPI0025A3F55B|nr:cupin domain-containing protein [Pseudomonas sp. SO81]
MRRSMLMFVLSALASAAALGHGGAGDETVTPVAAAELPAALGSHAQALRVEFAPGATSRPHTHPGAVFLVVVSGEVESALDGQPSQRFKAGEAWYEAPGQLHRVTRNPSSTQPATLVAWLLSDGKAALVRPVAH